MYQDNSISPEFTDAEIELEILMTKDLVKVETQYGGVWIDKDDPSIPLYKRWELGEIPTYVLEQELQMLAQ